MCWAPSATSHGSTTSYVAGPARGQESRFYLSLGDELMRRFNGAAAEPC